MAPHGTAWHSKAPSWLDTALHGTAWHLIARHGRATFGSAWLCKGPHGPTLQCDALRFTISAHATTHAAGLPCWIQPHAGSPVPSRRCFAVAQKAATASTSCWPHSMSAFSVMPMSLSASRLAGHYVQPFWEVWRCEQPGRTPSGAQWQRTCGALLRGCERTCARSLDMSCGHEASARPFMGCHCPSGAVDDVF
eukprot:356489-Chlamydomonas_euryale.AAC.2